MTFWKPNRFLASLALLGLAFSVLLPAYTVGAQSLSTNEIIDAVNALRASRGLAPYQIDAELMAYAQQHSDYQASIDSSTHNRPNGSTSWSVGIEENIAAGMVGYLTMDYIMANIWSDAIHMKTMVDFSNGYIGAGIAVRGSTIYITIDVRPGAALPPAPAATSKPGGKTTTPAGTATKLIPIEALLTATPRPDGAVIHKVGYGQTLWNIALAYGVKIDDIRRLNGLAADSNDIYAGWKLLIRPASPANATAAALAASAAAVTPSVTATLAPPTRTPRPPTVTLIPSKTPVPSLTPTPTTAPLTLESLFPDQKVIAVILIIICAAGLGVVVVSGFRKSS